MSRVRDAACIEGHAHSSAPSSSCRSRGPAPPTDVGPPDDPRPTCRLRTRVGLVGNLSSARLHERADTETSVLNCPEAQSGDIEGDGSLGRDLVLRAGPRDRNSSDLSRSYHVSLLDAEDVVLTSHSQRIDVGVCRRVVDDRVDDLASVAGFLALRLNCYEEFRPLCPVNLGPDVQNIRDRKFRAHRIPSLVPRTIISPNDLAIFATRIVNLRFGRFVIG